LRFEEMDAGVHGNLTSDQISAAPSFSVPEFPLGVQEQIKPRTDAEFQSSKYDTGDTAIGGVILRIRDVRSACKIG
jgi:hypothetical protein